MRESNCAVFRRVWVATRLAAWGLFVMLTAAGVAAQGFDPGQRIDGLSLAYFASRQIFTVADVNGDQYPDIVSGGVEPDEGEPAVIVLLNDGTGGFAAPSYFVDRDVDDLEDPVAVEVADVGSSSESGSFGEPDGNVDIIVLDTSAELIIVLWGNGAGGFEFALDAERFDLIDLVENEVIGLAVGDFDGQNGSDVAVLDVGFNPGLVFFICQLPRAPFVSCSTGIETTGGTGGDAGSDPFALVSGDFDGNGTTDIVALNSGPGNGTVTLIEGNGRGDFQSAAETANPVPVSGAMPTGLVQARIDSDALDDVGVVFLDEFAGDTVQIFLGRADRLSAQALMTGPFTPAAVAAADFNGDGAQDLVITQSGAEDAVVMRGDGTGIFTQIVPSEGTLTGQGIAVRTADLDRDGDSDFIVATDDRKGFRIALNRTLPLTTTPTATGPVATPTPTPIVDATPTTSGASTPTATKPAATATATSTRSSSTTIATQTVTPAQSVTATPADDDASADDEGCNTGPRTSNHGGTIPLLGAAMLWLARRDRRSSSDRIGPKMK